MSIIEMLILLTMCNEFVGREGGGDRQIVAVCAQNYENLKNEVADGDYLKYREWYEDNAEQLLKQYNDGTLIQNPDTDA